MKRSAYYSASLCVYRYINRTRKPFFLPCANFILGPLFLFPAAWPPPLAVFVSSLRPMDQTSPASPAQGGRVVRYSKKLRLGFIQPEGGGALVHFHLTACAPDYQHVHVGDEVAFEYDENDGRPCARRVRFLGNAALDVLRAGFEQGTVRQGFVKQIESDYYVKDVETHLFSKLVISPNEVDLGEIYEGSLSVLFQNDISGADIPVQDRGSAVV